MPQLELANSQTHFLRNGQPFFYLADTAWMAFSNLSLEDWETYLAYRKMQGFNAVQISILPITHDTSMGDDNLEPFLKDGSGNWDFSSYNDIYFDKAKTMVARAVDYGFIPVLGVLWCSYVPGTRCSASSLVASAMPLAAVTPYASYAAACFKSYDPIFFISGDTRFESEDEAPYYKAALEAVEAVCPEALLTMHLHPQGDLPQSFRDSVDFYMYQSGHQHVQDTPYLLAESFTNYTPKRPVLNSEPCYEGLARIGEQMRFSAFDVRKASWQSLLAGASMGVTYGAHGIWSFHREGLKFLNTQRFFEPFNWEVALGLEGAWDVGYAKWLFDSYDLFDLQPANTLLTIASPELRVACNDTQTRLAIYAPYSLDISLELDLAYFNIFAINLATRQVITPDIRPGQPSVINMPQFNNDLLFIASKATEATY
jgi:hypothetical protein